MRRAVDIAAPTLRARGPSPRVPGLRPACVRTACLLAASLFALSGCSNDQGPGSRSYHADIRWTAHGIPHVVGQSYGDAAFGSGYAFATLNICTLADQLVKVNSRRAYWFGPGEGDANIRSDFFERFLRVRERAEKGWARVSSPTREILDGFAAGYNQYLARVGSSGLPSRCRDAPWVTPIDGLDLLTYMNDLALVASSRALPLLSSLVDPFPQPPSKVARADEPGPLSLVRRFAHTLVRLASADRLWRRPQSLGVGSNGWALGGAKTATGKGMVLANPHFPWVGELKFWQLHLTANKPGYDVAGAALYGSPIPNIGFNATLGWTHTVSRSSKFTPYILKLDPEDPTAYLYDGKPRKMSARQETIEVKQPDGTRKRRTRTLWSSHYGPIIAVAGVADWTETTAYSIRDANAGNLGMVDQFLHVGLAKSVAELEEVMRTTQSNPWVNTIAADADGRAFYSESNSVPNLSQASYDAHKKRLDSGDLLTGLLATFGFYVLDGSTSRDEWQAAPGAREEGLVPFADTPHATRDDYVCNANESYWLSNVAAPITGYAPIFGKEGAVRSLRTRVTTAMILEKGDKAPAGEDGRFTLEELERVQFNQRGYGADLLLPEVRKMCIDLADNASVTDRARLDQGCAVLDKWDGRETLQSRGAILWREFFEQLAGDYNRDAHGGGVVLQHFDLQDPIGTPAGLGYRTAKGRLNKVPGALVKAVRRLEAAGIPPDAPLAGWQFTLKDGVKMPVPGGLQKNGMFNIAGWSDHRNTTLYTQAPHTGVLNSGTGLTRSGYVVNYGSSFIMALAFTADGPRGVHLLTYSQSSEPDSPYFKDQTERYAKGQWLPLLFRDADIEADAEYRKVRVRGDR